MILKEGAGAGFLKVGLFFFFFCSCLTNDPQRTNSHARGRRANSVSDGRRGIVELLRKSPPPTPLLWSELKTKTDFEKRSVNL